jgi:putative membrane protein (TIGR04086 family)
MNRDLVKHENIIVSIIKGAVVSVAVTLVLILAFALIIRFFNVNDNIIFPVNQVIKVVSLFVGVMILTKGNKEKGLLKGVLLGLIYFVLSFALFSILQGDFSFQLSNFYDLILTSLMGGIVGLIAVHIGK